MGCKFDGLWMVNQNSHRARKEFKKKRENEKKEFTNCLEKNYLKELKGVKSDEKENI